METTLYLVRHGETEYNVQARLQGWCDSPLTAGGLDGVRRTAERLRTHRFTAAYVSTSPRAMATAAVMLAHHPHVPVREVPDLREFGFGRMEGAREVDLLPDVDPYEMWVGIATGTFAGFPDGETGVTFRHRVLRAFRAIEAAHPGQDVLVVSHCLTLMTYFASIDPAISDVPRNAGVSVVDVGAGRRIRSVDARPPVAVG